MVNLPTTTTDVAETPSVQHQCDKLERRQCLLKVISTVRFLAHQALHLRGHGDECDCNFLQLLKLQGEG